MITNQTLCCHQEGRDKPVQLLRHQWFRRSFQPAKLIADYTKKGTGLTIEARIVTDSWTDKETKEQRTLTKLQLINMTLAPKGIADQKPVESKANVAGGQEVTSLWGGRTGDPEEQEVPSSPHQAAIAQEPASDPWKVQEPVGARGIFLISLVPTVLHRPMMKTLRSNDR